MEVKNAAADAQLPAPVKNFQGGTVRRGEQALGFDQVTQLPAQIGVRDAHEAPRLHEPDAGSVVGGVEQASQLLGFDAAAGEVPHVAPFEDDAVDRLRVLRLEGVR